MSKHTPGFNPQVGTDVLLRARGWWRVGRVSQCDVRRGETRFRVTYECAGVWRTTGQLDRDELLPVNSSVDDIEAADEDAQIPRALLARIDGEG